MSLSDLAQELIDQIIDTYAENPGSGGFTFLALISRAWVPRSRRYRFLNLTLYDDDFFKNHSTTCAILDGSDSIRSSVRRVSIVARPRKDPARPDDDWNAECRFAIEPQKLLQLLQRMPRLEEINMYDCAVEPPVPGDASSILPYCLDAPALRDVLYSPSFAGSPALDAFHTLLFLRNTRIGELHLRGLAPNPITTYFADDEAAQREALAARLARAPTPADLALLRPARVATLDMDRHAYSWAAKLAAPLLAAGVAETLFIVVYRKIWGSVRVYRFFERMAGTLTRLMLSGGNLDCESDGILGRQPLLKPCTALREVIIRLCPSYLTDQSVLNWSTLPLLPPSVEHFRVLISLPSIYREPPLRILQTWDKAMNWTEFKDVMRELPRLKNVSFGVVVEQDVTAVRREVECIAKRRLPEMDAAQMLHFAAESC